MRYHNESKDLRQCAALKTSIKGAVIEKMSLFFYLVRFITSISSTCFS